MKIIDLNIDCLEHIFNYLNLQDLLNVAVSNTALQYAAHLVFKRKHSQKMFVASLNVKLICRMGKETINPTQFQSFLLVFGDYIHTIALCYSDLKSNDRKNRKTFTKIIDTFRMCYTHINEEDQKHRRLFQEVFDAVSRHSFKALVGIAFFNFPKDWFSQFSRRLSKIKYVTFYNCHLGGDNNTLLLSRVFPKISYLNIICRKNSKHNHIIAHFPYLKFLEIAIPHNEYKSSEFVSLINLNPQLLKLKMKLKESSDLIRFIAEKSQLKIFDLCLMGSLPRNESIHFKRLKFFRYWCSEDRFPFTFDQLEKLELDRMKSLSIDQISKIIKQNNELVKVVLGNENVVKTINESKEQGRLPVITSNTNFWYYDRINNVLPVVIV